MSRIQESGSILKIGFGLSKWPHFHRFYQVTVCNRSFIAVCYESNILQNSKIIFFKQEIKFWSKTKNIEIEEQLWLMRYLIGLLYPTHTLYMYRFSGKSIAKSLKYWTDSNLQVCRVDGKSFFYFVHYKCAFKRIIQRCANF